MANPIDVLRSAFSYAFLLVMSFLSVFPF
ncbi:MAG: hypothetical protein RIR97_2093, partial [Pseudomonadota bacterium]